MIKLIIEANKNGTARLMVDGYDVAVWYITDYMQNDNFINLYDENRILVGDVCLDYVELIINDN